MFCEHLHLPCVDLQPFSPCLLSFPYSFFFFFFIGGKRKLFASILLSLILELKYYVFYSAFAFVVALWINLPNRLHITFVSNIAHAGHLSWYSTASL